MALDPAVLRESFALVVDRNPDLTARFYDRLFERYPATRALFGRNTRKHQEQMLGQALSSVLDHLEDAPWLTEQLRALGDKHKEYGVTREMYDWVGETLIATLAESAGGAWTPEMERNWVEAYGVIVALMN